MGVAKGYEGVVNEMFWNRRNHGDEEYSDDFESAFNDYTEDEFFEEDEPQTSEENHSTSHSNENDAVPLEESDEHAQQKKDSDCEDDTNESIEGEIDEIGDEKGTGGDDFESEKTEEDEVDIQEQKKKIKAIAGGLVGAFLLGLGIFAYQPIMNNLVAPLAIAHAADKAYSLDGEEMQENEANLKQIVMDDEEKMKELFGFEDVELLGTFNPSLTIQKKNVVGGIYIPKANINLPILYGSTNKNLNVGATTMKPTQVMGEGNYALAGHNARNRSILFAGLRYLNVEENPKVYITDKNKLYEYTLTSSQIVKPSKVDVIADVDGQRMITLVTCYAWDGSNRLVLQGELTSVIDYAEADTSIQKVFNSL